MPESGSLLTPRPGRRSGRVVRACDWCRRHRTKCDSRIPCSNCSERGLSCSNNTVQETSLPEAVREIERLRHRVEQLEQNLRQERGRSSRLELQLEQARVASATSGKAHHQIKTSGLEDGRKLWTGVFVGTARSTHKTRYGPSSLFFFISRTAAFLNSTLRQNRSVDHLLSLNSARVLLDGPTNSSPTSSRAPQPRDQQNGTREAGGFLTLAQEEYFLDLYWQSYHACLIPIIDESDFKRHYHSLWPTSGNEPRAASALVDIVLALCMQYGLSMTTVARQKLIVTNDATVAGQQYYHRCQKLLAYQQENPTISTLQCHLLCVTYLCCGTFQNMADSACALAIRTAQMLGIHLDPPDTVPQQQREMHRRLWSSLCMLDNKIAMKLGRPFIIQPDPLAPRLLSDRLDVAMQTGSSFAPLGNDTSWLSFHLQHAKLFTEAREVYTAFFNHPARIRGASIWDDPDALESLARVVQGHESNLRTWVDNVSPPLTTKRQSGSPPFSLDGAALNIEQFAPLWIQRQRILLELIYHNLCMNLYRPFISFNYPAEPTTLSGELAVKCALHAMTLTQITHQTLTSSSILDGWHESFQWQWNAAMTLVGYCLAYPSKPTTLAAKGAMCTSIDVFDIFGRGFSVATSAARVVREMCTTVDFLIQTHGDRPDEHDGDVNSQSATGDAGRSSQAAGTNAEPDGALIQDMLQMAFDVDQWADLDTLLPADGTRNSMAQEEL